MAVAWSEGATATERHRRHMPWDPPMFLDPVRRQDAFDEPARWQSPTWPGWYRPMTAVVAQSPAVVSVARALSDWHHLATEHIRCFTGMHPSVVSRTLDTLRRARVVERAWIDKPEPPVGFIWRFGPAAEKWRAGLPKDVAAAVTQTAHISRRRGAARHDLCAAALGLALSEHPLVSSVGPEWDSRAEVFLPSTTSGARGDLVVRLADGTAVVVEITADVASAATKALRWGKFVQDLPREDTFGVVFLNATSRVPVRYLRRGIERALSFEGMGSLTEGLAPPWTVSQARERIFVANWTDWVDDNGCLSPDLPARRLTDEDVWEEGAFAP